MQQVAGNTWCKEDELKELKSKLAAIDRKIQLELAPPAQEIMEEDIHWQKNPKYQTIRKL